MFVDTGRAERSPSLLRCGPYNGAIVIEYVRELLYRPVGHAHVYGAVPTRPRLRAQTLELTPRLGVYVLDMK